MLVFMSADPTLRAAMPFTMSPEGEVVALSGPDDEGPYYKSGYWRGTDGQGVVNGQRFGVLTGRHRVDWCNDEDDLPEWVQYALNDYRSKKK